MRGAGGPSSPGQGPGLLADFLHINTGASVFPLALLGVRGLPIWEHCPELGGTQIARLGEPRSQMPPMELGGREVNQLFEDLSLGPSVCLCFH